MLCQYLYLLVKLLQWLSSAHATFDAGLTQYWLNTTLPVGCTKLRQNLPAPVDTFSCSRARCYTCSFLNSATSISGPKSNFVIRHNFTCTSSNIIYCISCSKCCKLYIGETGRRLSDRFAEHLRSVRNNDVDKPVARHFNAANHSISDMKICAISPISGGNDSRKRHEKRLIFKIGTIHPHGLNERFSFIWSHLFIVSHLFISHLHLVYWSTLKIANDLPIFASYYVFVIVFLTWLAYIRSHDYLSYINSLVFLFIFCFSLTKGQCSKR